ncbi:MAG: hypothetical protein HZA31_11445 [Opitutae bacterium]|nr:hypothetical protein [Opitutae bacterium]
MVENKDGFLAVRALFALALALALGLTARAVNIAEQELKVQLTEVAAPGRQFSTLARGADGALALAWIESDGDVPVGKFSWWDAARRQWGEPRTIARGAELEMTVNGALSLAVQPGGSLAAVWTGFRRKEGRSHFCSWWSLSTDGGATWSKPLPLAPEHTATRGAAVVALADGRFLAAWFGYSGAKESIVEWPLCARIVGRDEPVQRVDAHGYGASPLTLAAFPDGSASLAYRTRNQDGVCDPVVARFAEGVWEAPAPVGSEGWKIELGVAAGGPRLTLDGPRMAAAWITEADNEPRVLSSTSPDAGGLWTMAQRIDLGRPVACGDVLLLRDGSHYVLWNEKHGDDVSQPAGVYLRRVNPYGGLMRPARVATTPPTKYESMSRLALVKEEDAAGPAQLLVAYVEHGRRPTLHTVLVTLPTTAELMEMDMECECSAGKEPVRGYAVKGRILAVNEAQATFRVRHEPVPGLLRAGELELRVAPAVAAAVAKAPERGFLGRLEKRAGDWWLFDVRLLGER